MAVEVSSQIDNSCLPYNLSGYAYEEVEKFVENIIGTPFINNPSTKLVKSLPRGIPKSLYGERWSTLDNKEILGSRERPYIMKTADKFIVSVPDHCDDSHKNTITALHNFSEPFKNGVNSIDVISISKDWFTDMKTHDETKPFVHAYVAILVIKFN